MQKFIYTVAILFAVVGASGFAVIWYNNNQTGTIKTFTGKVTDYKDQSDKDACSYYELDYTKYVMVKCHGTQFRDLQGSADREAGPGDTVEVRATYTGNATNSTIKTYDIDKSDTYIREVN